MALFMAVSILGVSGKGTPPKNWWTADCPDYEVGVDAETKYKDKPSVFLKFIGTDKIAEKSADFTTLSQTIKAVKYRGKRVRFSAYIKSRDAASARLWMRVDGKSGDDAPAKDPILRFDNMEDRAIKGTAAWTKCEIVLDIPPESETIIFGFMLCGKGRMWGGGALFEIVDDKVPTTDMLTWNVLSDQPLNLDFKE